MTLTTDPITERIRHIVSSALGFDANQMAADQCLHNDFGADSLDAVELVIEIEREFGIEIADEDGYLDLKAVADIAEHVRRVAEQQGVPLS